MKISVIIPSVREDGFELTYQSLLLQSFPKQDFEIIVCSPFVPIDFDIWISEPKKRENDFWNLYKGLNKCFERARGELIVWTNDSQYLAPDVLQKFWDHYDKNPLSCVCGIGDHFEKVENGQGEGLTYHDARWTQYKNVFSETTPINFDGILSFPIQAVAVSGNVNEKFDEGCCFGEREMWKRFIKNGYELYIDTSINYVARAHDKKYDPDNKWESMFKKNEELYFQLTGEK